LLEYNFHRAAQNAGDNFILVQQQFAQKLYDEDGLEINTVKHVIDILAIAIGVKDVSELDIVEEDSDENNSNVTALISDELSKALGDVKTLQSKFEYSLNQFRKKCNEVWLPAFAEYSDMILKNGIKCYYGEYYYNEDEDKNEDKELFGLPDYFSACRFDLYFGDYEYDLYSEKKYYSFFLHLDMNGIVSLYKGIISHWDSYDRFPRSLKDYCGSGNYLGQPCKIEDMTKELIISNLQELTIKFLEDVKKNPGHIR
jgi:hypothetical protein